MTSDQDKIKLSDFSHSLIHSLRLIAGYKPSLAEIKLSREVIKTYKDNCDECKQAEETIKNQPVKSNGIIDKVKSALGGN